MKIALIMNKNSYPGREYLTHLMEAGIKVDVITIGDYPEVNSSEELRYGGHWQPTREDKLMSFFDFYRFDNLKSPELIEFLQEKKYDFGIQGGTGILKSSLIGHFKTAILSFHPGDLPAYRGCSAPEWQLVENNPIISTCHFVDAGIDSGAIVAKKELTVSKNSYEEFRSSVYPETAKFVVEVFSNIVANNGLINKPKPQREDEAIYRQYIGEERIENIKKTLF